MEYDVVARRSGEGIRFLLRRLATMLGGLAVVTAVVCTATFATGWWVFGGGLGWAVVGGVACALPVAAGIGGWALVRGAAHYAPRLVNDIAEFIRTPSQAAQVLIDYDSGEAITVSAKRFGTLRDGLSPRRSDLPALWVGVRAITLAPVLAAVALLGMLADGALGTILLIGGLID